MGKKLCFGADVGGTTVKIGLFNELGENLDKWEIKTRKEHHGKYILPDTAASILSKIQEKKLSLEQISGIGLGVPGPVTEDGLVNICVNLGWGTVNVVQELSHLTNLPVKANNDANVAALGEMWQGGGKGYQNLIMVTLGTGVGGGIIVNGKIVSGANGAAGEIGHMTVDPTEQATCNCQKKGCLEQFASATGIVRIAKKMRTAYDGTSILKKQETISAKNVLDGAKQGDSLCLAILDKVTYYLGWALSNVSIVTDPEAIVIGGGVSKAGNFLLDSIQREYLKTAFHTSKNTVFKIAQLGNDAGIYGCAKLILDSI